MSGTSRRTLRCAILLGALAVAATAAYSRIWPLKEPSSDALEYHRIAVNLASGGGFCIYPGVPSVKRPPLFPAALSLVYRTFGTGAGWARGLQSGFIVVASLLVFLLGVMTEGAHRTGFLAGALFALDPSVNSLASELLLDPLLTCMVLAAALVTVLAARNATPRALLGAGAAWGLALLCKATVLAVVPFLMLVLWCRARWLILFLPAGAVLLLLPWTARYTVLTGRPGLVATGFGAALWAGTYPPWNGDWQGVDHPPLARTLEAAGYFDEGFTAAEDARLDARLLGDAIGNVVKAPASQIRLAGLKLHHFLLRRPYMGWSATHSPLEKLHILFHWVVLLLAAVAGARLVAARNPSPRSTTALLFMIVLGITAFHTAVIGGYRYQAPLIGPLLVIAVDEALRIGDAARERFRPGRRRPPVPLSYSP